VLEEHKEYGVPTGIIIGEGEMYLRWQTPRGYCLYVTVWPEYLWEHYGQYTTSAWRRKELESQREVATLEQVYEEIRDYVAMERLEEAC
jgi:hypothetical protein